MRRTWISAAWMIVWLMITAVLPAGAMAADGNASEPLRPDSGGQIIESVQDLPLVEVKSSGQETDTMALLITGDGGWSSFDRGVSNALAKDGIPVIGVNALKYFWTKRSPETTAADMTRVLRAYLAAWHKSRILLVGYSFGGEVMPFVYNRLPEDLQKRVVLSALLGASPHADFEFHVTYWAHLPGTEKWPVAPEVEKMRGRRVLVIFGEDEKDTLAKVLPPNAATLIELKGGHHFGNDYEGIEERILSEMR
jgi:type IV secretory pathway VirJ component